jgi:hypothetical protein
VLEAWPCEEAGKVTGQICQIQQLTHVHADDVTSVRHVSERCREFGDGRRDAITMTAPIGQTHPCRTQHEWMVLEN